MATHHVREDFERRVRSVADRANAALADLELFKGQNGCRDAEKEQKHVCGGCKRFEKNERGERSRRKRTQVVDVKLLDKRVTSAQLRDNEHHRQADGESVCEEFVVRARELDL